MGVLPKRTFVLAAAATVCCIALLSWFTLDFAWFKFYQDKPAFVNAIVLDKTAKATQFDVVELDMLNVSAIVLTPIEAIFVAVLCIALLSMTNLFVLFCKHKIESFKAIKVLTAKQLVAANIVFVISYACICALTAWQFNWFWLLCSICLAILIEFVALTWLNRKNMT